MIKKIIINSISLILITSISLFLIVYIFFYNENYYDYSIFINSFILPTIFIGSSIYAILNHRKIKSVGFRDCFSISFITMFISGTIFMIFIFIFMNFISPESARVFQVQRTEINLKNATNEYSEYIKNKDQEKIKMYNQIKETLTSEQEKNKNIFDLKNTFMILGLFYVGYLFLSLILSLFLRNKKVNE